jgi:anti-sigma regulatory factor (Ser/Thr protein kinase)
VIGTDPRVTTAPAKAPGANWELHTSLELGALPTAVPCARLHARQVLWEWHLDELSETAELIVSELVTNAVQASVGLTGSRRSGRWVPGTPPVRLWLSSDKERVLIQVWDSSDRHPAPQQPGPDVESGRGLLLVESLSAEWGSYPPERSSGKVVWALIAPE